MPKTGRVFFMSFFVSWLMLFSSICWATDTLKVEVVPESVGLGDTVQIVLTIQSSEDFEALDPQVPEIEGLKLLQAQNAGQSSSTRMNFINGKTEFSKTVQQQYVFFYEALLPGIVTIPSFTVDINGRQIRSAPQKISISQKSQKSAPRQRPPVAGRPQFPDDPFEEDDMFAQLMRQRQKMLEEMQNQLRGQGLGQGFGQGFGGQGPRQQVPSKQIEGLNTNEAFFILLEADKKTVYEGEQVTASWYIYTRGNMESLDRAKFPDLKGFWKEIIEEVPSLQFSEEVVNGVVYRKALLAAHALFPIKPGKTEIDEFKIKARVRLPTQFGWGQAREYTKSSRRFEINVLPLPKENKPLSFSGAVGQFQIQTQISGTQFPAGQPISLKVRLEGQGNAKMIELPEISWPDNLQVYDTKSESKFFKDGLSYKEFEILLIAQNPGPVNIPQINFSYFDPTLKQYVTKSTEEFAIEITEALPGSQIAPLKASEQLGQSLESEKILLPVTELSNASFSWSTYRWAVLLVLSVGAVLTVMIQFLRSLMQMQRSPELSYKVDLKMKIIEKAVDSKNYKLFAAEAINLLYLLAGHLSQEQSATDDWTVLFQRMPENYRQSYQSQMNTLFDYFQIIGFAPESLREQALSLNSPDKMFAELKNLSRRISTDIPK